MDSHRILEATGSVVSRATTTPELAKAWRWLIIDYS